MMDFPWLDAVRPVVTVPKVRGTNLHFSASYWLSEILVQTSGRYFPKRVSPRGEKAAGEQRVSTLEIIHGEGDLNIENLARMKVDKLIIHPHSDSWLLDDDIALLLLKSPLNLGAKAAPICLSEVTDIQKWTNGWVSGRGMTSE
ncbi:hypothetical protein MC885_001330 [Smutsia gigantea]|nr:hypothetical protein MC885_001330 [Smutsia gigantea]